MIIDTEKLEKYLSDNNQMYQPMVMCLGTKKEALDYYNTYDGQNFKSIEEMEQYVDVYYFIYEGKWYHICYDEALDVVTDRENFFKPIKDHKALHMNGVAKHMSKMAKLFGIKEEEAFFLGYIHDIGYINGRKEHGLNGYNLLFQYGLDEKFLNAIRYHGKKPSIVPKECITPYLLCLWDGDLSVNTTGEDVGWRKRLKDIEKRYGKDSEAYVTAKETVEYVKAYLKSKS